MKIIVKLEDVNARETVKNERKSLMVRVKGRDKNGVGKSSYLFDDQGRAFEAKIAELVPSGVDYNNGIMIEFNGFEKKSTQNDSTFFSVSSFNVLTGAELELQKIKFSAADLEKKLKSLSTDDINGRYAAMAEYIASTGIDTTPVVSEVVAEKPEVVAEAKIENPTPEENDEVISEVLEPEVITETIKVEPAIETVEAITEEAIIEPTVETEPQAETISVSEAVVTAPEEPNAVEVTPQVETVVDEPTATEETVVTEIAPEVNAEVIEPVVETQDAVAEVAEVIKPVEATIVPEVVKPIRTSYRTIRTLEETEGEVEVLASNPEEDAKLQLGSPPPPPKPKSVFTKPSPFGRGFGGLAKPVGTPSVVENSPPTPPAPPASAPVVDGPVRGYKPAGFAMRR